MMHDMFYVFVAEFLILPKNGPDPEPTLKKMLIRQRYPDPKL